MREIKFKFLMENGEVTKPCYLLELIDSDSYINIECEYSSKIKQELQYTGLKDKNGIELYDGDIVKDSSARLMIVEWDDRIGTSRFIFKTINNIGHIKNGRYLNTNEWITSTENDIEIIGNIYQNQELLNEI